MSAVAMPADATLETMLITAALSSLAPTTGVVIALIRLRQAKIEAKAQVAEAKLEVERTRQQLVEFHVEVNGRMTELVERVAQASDLEGERRGRRAEHDEQEARDRGSGSDSGM